MCVAAAAERALRQRLGFRAKRPEAKCVKAPVLLSDSGSMAMAGPRPPGKLKRNVAKGPAAERRR
jgi:hypothetical protein